MADIKFRASRLILSTGLFASCAAWLLMRPETNGFVGQLVGGGDRITLIGGTAIACALALSALFSFYLIRLAFGKPALCATDTELRVHVLPFQTYLLCQLEDVRIEGDSLVIVPVTGRVRKIKLAILRDCEAAVEGIRARVGRKPQR